MRIYGPDLDRLARLGQEAREILESIEGITDLRAETLTGLPQIRITVDREAVARVGLQPADVRALAPARAGQMRGGGNGRGERSAEFFREEADARENLTNRKRNEEPAAQLRTTLMEPCLSRARQEKRAASSAYF